MFKFLSDIKFTCAKLLQVHEFLCLAANSFVESENWEMILLNYYNTYNHTSNANGKNMDPMVIQYVQDEMYKSVKKVHFMGLKQKLLTHLLFFMACLWDEQPDANPPITIQYMYIKEKQITVTVTSKDVLHWTRLIWGHIDEIFYGRIANAQSLDRWLVYVQKTNMLRQNAQYMANCVELKLNELNKFQENEENMLKSSKIDDSKHD